MTDICILQSSLFRKSYKKLHANQKLDVNEAIAEIVKNPHIGESKTGDLAGIFVYKFKCCGQLTLLAYEFDPQTRHLLLLGAHENFYRDLKR